jgi:two-component system NarL family sensor kinase
MLCSDRFDGRVIGPPCLAPVPAIGYLRCTGLVNNIGSKTEIELTAVLTTEQTLHALQERVKELTALHSTSRLLQSHTRPTAELLQEVVELLPAGWQYPEITGARIRCLGREFITPNFAETAWVQSAALDIESDKAGSVDICYLESRPDAAEGPFLAEERELIESIAEMIRSHLQHREADDALLTARAELEKQVAARTADLERANRELQSQVEEQSRTADKIREYQERLGRLALELSLTEARERREIAEDLHDHIGQALAFVKLKVSQFRGDAVFCGFEDTISEVIILLDQTIAYTRNLTLQISPPVLYEFGLVAAVDWLAESFGKEHKLRVQVRAAKFKSKLPPEHAALLFKSINELLTNVVRHSGGSTVLISVAESNDHLQITVSDNGRGCDANQVLEGTARSGKFGLFSVRERMRFLGGDMQMESSPNRGTTVELKMPISGGSGHE